jgi:uncharacterized phage protein gp47/JayE
MSDAEFTEILENAGIPTTQEALEAQWKADVKASGSKINNDSLYSPFWRIVNTLVTTPALWLIQLTINTVLPNSFVKYAKGTFLELLADAFNLTRKAATKAEGIITFTRNDVTAAVTIPTGTIIQTPTLNGKIYQVITTAEGSFTAGSLTTTVSVKAVEAGSTFNLAVGYFSILASPIANINSVINAEGWLSVPGADEENDDALRERIRNQFGTASDFHTDSVYKSLIASFPGVDVNSIWFLHDAPRGPGTANAYVLFDFSAPIETYLANINAYIMDEGHHGHGDDLMVYQLPTRYINLVVNLWYGTFLTSDEITQLQADVIDFIRAAFRQNTLYTPTTTLPFSRFSFSKLGQDLHAEFPEISSVNFDLDDIITEMWIPIISDLNVNMQVV